ncbi:hypothetical protein V8B55DRAFT_1583949 [Mucor lusitanicus]|uniref:XPG-I domain-containing protein n=1 Tax=Mucor lusitanicus CBS 277.49 TaxID=747725 RepID=A0A168P883_MUCCL|nr:hypothetical protein MUCCIDRAFT_77706 [Mucor lusitanicus CBS 277.49]
MTLACIRQASSTLILVGGFYDSIRRYFLNCHEHQESKKITAANRLLAEINNMFDKKRCILYIDGTPTMQRDFAHTKRLDKLLEVQAKLETEVREYNNIRTKMRHKTIMYLARQLFRVNPDIERVIRTTAEASGWNVIVAKGEAEVEIGKAGGIVYTQDSDMLFYPKIKTVICPFDGTFRFYDKSVILPQLDLTSEFFTVMGIIAKNDYEEDFYAGEMEEGNRDFYRDRMIDIYKELVDIKRDSFNVGSLSGNTLIQAILKAYVSFMNAKTGKRIAVDAYENSYSIFALQQEQTLVEAYDPRSYEINLPALYLDRIQNYPRYFRD